MTESDPQLEELARQSALLREEALGFMDFADEFAGVNQHLDQLITGLDEIGRELDDAVARLEQEESKDGRGDRI
ncbi:hypothetical protein [Nocardia inohanensis]|uniref:hypothetical protein n=1 Tax=Nocardia inohanensis TaxID=209246 RepID=UPI0009FEB96E|nr:hypothetical protein [Nocardia inohanensis]